MNDATLAGLKKWAKARSTKTIAAHLEGHDIDDPKALAVWIRKQAIGETAFAKRQAAARKRKGFDKDS